jgi:hypothetical protein
MLDPIIDPRHLTGAETLVFVHIPKTAGSTLNAVIDANYNASAIAQVESPVRKGVEDLIALPADRQRGIRVVRGHGTMGMHASWGGACAYITLLRDPVDRVVSQFHFIKESKTHPLGKQIREEGVTLDCYVSEGLNPQLENGQVRALSAEGNGVGRDVPFGECTPAMLARAIAAVDKQFILVGLQERFEESLALMASVLGWTIPHVEACKVTRQRPRVDALPEKTRELIMAQNLLDGELYAHVAARFEKQVSVL